MPVFALNLGSDCLRCLDLLNIHKYDGEICCFKFLDKCPYRERIEKLKKEKEESNEK